jgi:hypothetical protein
VCDADFKGISRRLHFASFAIAKQWRGTYARYQMVVMQLREEASGHGVWGCIHAAEKGFVAAAVVIPMLAMTVIWRVVLIESTWRAV